MSTSLGPVIFNLATLAEAVGRQAASPWIDVTQDMIGSFADATGDRQWIHLDAERARRDSPHGTTIAHGFLTLSLISQMLRTAIRFETVPRMAINYGLNRARFTGIVPVGARVRGRFTLVHVRTARSGGCLTTWGTVVEREGADTPCCVAEWMVLYHP